MKIKSFVKEFIPPIFWKIYRNNQSEYGFFGNYPTWEEAMKDAEGYDKDIILETVKNSLLQVKEGKAIYERDSVLFDKIEYSFPVLTMLLKVALENQGKLSVLDFGGSLGSHYFQYRKFLADVTELQWSIVEQSKFVQCGQEFFANDELKFYYDIDRCLQQRNPQLILLSGVLQCLEKPYEMLEYILEKDFKYIVFDRTAFVKGNLGEILTLQKVPPSIYPASYPAWFLNRNKFLNYIQEKYNTIIECDGVDKVNLESDYKIFVFQRKENA
jgi:putative methyltransferase (TIGR04325 family)